MMNNGTKSRPGTGCPPPDGDVLEPEVLPTYNGGYDGNALRVGRVHFDRRTTLESPAFWALLGLAAGGLLTYMILREKNR